MDLHQIQYIVTIAEEQSITKAAEKLFMTQSALNQQLLKLERELGTPLFERKKHSMIPTFAGNIYLESCRQILNIKKDTYKIIYDISQEDAGMISVAYTPERGAQMFSEIYLYFHQKYPKVLFKIHEGRAKDMEQMILKREADIAFCVYENGHTRPQFEYIELKTEPIVLAVPKTHPRAVLAGSNSHETLPEIDIRLLRDSDFILSSKSTRIRDMSEQVFEKAGFRPHVLFESTSTSTIINMVRSQVCCAFIPGSYIDPAEPMVYFTVTPRIYWTQSAMMLPGTYLTKPEKYLIKLAKLQACHQLPVSGAEGAE
ncbi:MAG: LysR family transcriptional regulator [Clostridiales bacterium]|nr:LysR family transcriptional regulator [Clostridiales bacterium]